MLVGDRIDQIVSSVGGRVVTCACADIVLKGAGGDYRFRRKVGDGRVKAPTTARPQSRKSARLTARAGVAMGTSRSLSKHSQDGRRHQRRWIKSFLIRVLSNEVHSGRFKLKR